MRSGIWSEHKQEFACVGHIFYTREYNYKHNALSWKFVIVGTQKNAHIMLT